MIDNELYRNGTSIADIIDLSFYENKEILITGASGLIGSNLCVSIEEAFRREGVKLPKITLISNSNHYMFESSNNFKKFQFNLEDVKKLRRLSKFDIIIHAATYGQPYKFLDKKIETFNLNISTTFELLKKVKENGTFLYLSSSEIYTGLTNSEFSETEAGISNTIHPRAAYIEGKRGGETLVNISSQEMGIRGIIARIALAYGPGTRLGDRRALNEFIQMGLKEKCIQLKDEGSAVRTYCYITDASKMLFGLLQKGQGEIYNVGGNSKVTIRMLAEKIAQLTDSRIIINDYNQHGVVNSSAPEEVTLSLKKINSIAPIKDYVDLDEGLEKTINWYRFLLNRHQ